MSDHDAIDALAGHLDRALREIQSLKGCVDVLAARAYVAEERARVSEQRIHELQAAIFELEAVPERTRQRTPLVAPVGPSVQERVRARIAAKRLERAA